MTCKTTCLSAEIAQKSPHDHCKWSNLDSSILLPLCVSLRRNISNSSGILSCQIFLTINSAGGCSFPRVVRVFIHSGILRSDCPGRSAPSSRSPLSVCGGCWAAIYRPLKRRVHRDPQTARLCANHIAFLFLTASPPSSFTALFTSWLIFLNPKGRFFCWCSCFGRN